MISLNVGLAQVTKTGGQSFKVVDKFCYLRDILGVNQGTVNSVSARVRNEWLAFRDL